MAVILYDLSCKVNASPEDEEVMSLVNSHSARNLCGSVILADEDGLWITAKPVPLGERMKRIAKTAANALLWCSSIAAFICSGLCIGVIGANPALAFSGALLPVSMLVLSMVRKGGHKNA